MSGDIARREHLAAHLIDLRLLNIHRGSFVTGLLWPRRRQGAINEPMLSQRSHLSFEIAKRNVDPFFVRRQRGAERSDGEAIEAASKARFQVAAGLDLAVDFDGAAYWNAIPIEEFHSGFEGRGFAARPGLNIEVPGSYARDQEFFRSIPLAIDIEVFLNQEGKKRNSVLEGAGQQVARMNVAKGREDLQQSLMELHFIFHPVLCFQPVLKQLQSLDGIDGG